jgi:predicted transcriptional regulator
MGLFDVKKLASAIVDLVRSRPSPEPISPSDAAARTAAVEEALAQVRAGETIPAEDVEAWIDSWDTKNELPTPTPKWR